MPVQLSNSKNIIITRVSGNRYNYLYPTYFTDIDFSKNYTTGSIEYNCVHTRYIEGGNRAPLSLDFIGVVLNTL